MTDTSHVLNIAAGCHARRDCPVVLSIEAIKWVSGTDSLDSLIAPSTDGPFPTKSPVGILRGLEGGAIPFQRLKHDRVALILGPLERGETMVCDECTEASAEAASTEGNRAQRSVIVTQTGDSTITIEVNGRLMTRYNFDRGLVRPYFYPVISAEGIPVTRGFPMILDAPEETTDHPHHKSLWIAHGDVNGVDNWSENEGHGFTAHQSISELFSGPVTGGFQTTSYWTDSHRRPVLTQELRVLAWATSDAVRIMDFEINLVAAHGDATFGDTKEGGILSIRVASTMDGSRGGRIENSYGGVSEAETWGKAAHWCDYSGITSDGPVGVAVMDHPLSFRYPTHWHVRDYGLMTANPFGYAAYTNGEKDGAYTLKSGDRLRFHYRILIHGDEQVEDFVRAHYLNWSAPPTVTATTRRPTS